MKLFDAVKPMLASAANEPPDRLWKQLGDGWVFEPKLDGFRCLVHANANRVILRSRNGNDITARFQHTSLPSFINPVVLDGELIAVDDDGKPAFNQVQRVQGKPGDPVASFVAFDMLWDAGNGDIRRLPWAVRREALDHYVEVGISVVPFSTDGPHTWAAAQEHGLEGVVAKRATSAYVSGKSSDWLKVKQKRSLSVVATGFSAGKGSRITAFGALEIALLDNGELVPLGTVGSGLSGRDLVVLAKLEPPFVVEVEFHEWTGSALRAPVFKGLRDDVPLSDCTFDKQLGVARRI